MSGLIALLDDVAGIAKIAAASVDDVAGQAAKAGAKALKINGAINLAFGLIGLVAVLVVDEGRRRLRSKDIPHIFRGLPSVLIYIGILSLAIYGLVGTVD